MRRRLLISMLPVAIAAVLALGIPLAIVLGRLQIDQANQSLHRNAEDLSDDLVKRFSSGDPLGPAYAMQQARSLPGRYVVIWQGGRKLAIGGTKPAAHAVRAAKFASTTAPA